MEKLTNCNEFNKAIKFNTIANLQKQDSNLMAKKFELSINLAMVTNEAFNYFKSSECKELLKSLDVKMDAKKFAEYLKMSKSYMYLLCQCANVSLDVLNEYRQTSDEKSLKGLVKFASPSDVSDTNEQTDETDETDETEKSVKVETELKISIKKGKITIKGNCENSEIDLLIAELQRMKQAKNSPKAA